MFLVFCFVLWAKTQVSRKLNRLLTVGSGRTQFQFILVETTIRQKIFIMYCQKPKLPDKLPVSGQRTVQISTDKIQYLLELYSRIRINRIRNSANFAFTVQYETYLKIALFLRFAHVDLSTYLNCNQPLSRSTMKSVFSLKYHHLNTNNGIIKRYETTKHLE